MKPIPLPDDARDAAVASLKRFADEELEWELGTLGAGWLLDFVLREIGPFAYNAGVRDARDRIEGVTQDLDVDLHRPELGHWTKPR